MPVLPSTRSSPSAPAAVAFTPRGASSLHPPAGPGRPAWRRSHRPGGARCWARTPVPLARRDPGPGAAAACGPVGAAPNAAADSGRRSAAEAGGMLRPRIPWSPRPRLLGFFFRRHPAAGDSPATFSCRIRAAQRRARPDASPGARNRRRRAVRPGKPPARLLLRCPGLRLNPPLIRGNSAPRSAPLRHATHALALVHLCPCAADLAVADSPPPARRSIRRRMGCRCRATRPARARRSAGHLRRLG